MASADSVSVLKLAVFPAPSAMIPPLQLALLVQLPPLGFVQVPVVAGADTAPAQSQTASNPGIVRLLFISKNFGSGTLFSDNDVSN